jgi:hypothetical protein
VWVNGGSYEAWAAFLDQWAAGESLDPAALPKLAPEDFTSDSWQRLVDRVTDALSQRLKAWSGTLERELSSARDEFTAGRALNHARWSLPPIRAVAASPALPEELGKRLLDLVDTQIRSTQQQLDEQMERLRRSGAARTAVEARLRTIRENPLTAVTDGTGGHATGDGWATDPTATPRRRVIVTDSPRKPHVELR